MPPRDYSPLNGLAWSLWPSDDHRDTRLMAFFTAYFDAAGKPDRPNVMFVSGFVSTVGKWKKFEKAWLAFLKRNGMENPFHMTEFKHATSEHYKGKNYPGWVNRHDEQRAFEIEAIRIIDYHTHKEFSQGLVVEDFERMHREYDIPITHPWGRLINKPIAHCGIQPIIALQDWEKSYRKRGNTIHGIELIFDQGDTHRGELASAIREVFDVEPIFKDKREHIGLQAADILAWYHSRVTGDITYNRRIHILPQLEVLMKWMRNSEEWGYSHWPKLEQACAHYGFKRKGE